MLHDACLLDYDTDQRIGHVSVMFDRTATPTSGDPSLHEQHRLLLVRITYSADVSNVDHNQWGVFSYYSTNEFGIAIKSKDVWIKYGATYADYNIAETDYTNYGAGFVLTGNANQSFILSSRCLDAGGLASE